MQVDNIKKIAVIGSGLMGNGIAQVCATSGYNVSMIDIDQAFVDKGLASIEKSLARIVKKGKLTQEESDVIRKRITGLTNLREGITDADVVIEAVTEKIDIKNNLWKEIGEHAKQGAIFASNTSSISITSMATVSKRSENFIGMHFFNPVPIMNLVEIIRGQLTSDETHKTISELSKKLGKEVITVNEAPGFAVNRVLIPFMLEAIRAIEQGVCTPEDMDTGCKLGLNHPMGPCTLLDYVGLDTTLFIADYMFEETGNPMFKAPNMLRKMVRAGLYGVKSGRGFYNYQK